LFEFKKVKITLKGKVVLESFIMLTQFEWVLVMSDKLKPTKSKSIDIGGIIGD